MTACPSCKHVLSETELKSGSCPACGAKIDIPPVENRGGMTIDLSQLASVADTDSVEIKPPSDEPPANRIGATVDLGSGLKTVDSSNLPWPPPGTNIGSTVDLSKIGTISDTDSVQMGQLGMIPGETNLNATIDTGRVGQTVDSVDLPVQPPAPGQGATVDLSKLGQTLDSSSVEIGPKTPPSPDLGATIDTSKIAQTHDSVDVPLEPKVGTGTVTNRRFDKTIDSTNMSQFIDQSKQTAGDMPLNQTVESISFPYASEEGPKPGTVVDGKINVTVDSQEFAPIPKAPGTVQDRRGQATYDSGDVSTGEARQVDNMWRGANVEKASPRMTIKGREAQKQTARSSLVIQPRNFREAKSQDVQTIADADYDLIKMLGQGGMGVVYAARQASIDRTVAIKMLKPDMARDQAQRNKFLAEAVITGDLDHPNIVPIYDLGKNPQGALFYAMKKVQGTPWDKVIYKKSLSENIDILLKVADAVAFAHSRGVVHRDLKPENTMLGDFGEVLVMDWGLALPFGKFEKSRSIVPSASMGGTPAYMAPEMATGPFDKIGPTSDVYLLGAMLYEIITKNPPHTGKDVMKCLFAAAKNEIQPTDKSGELIDIARKAMATKQPERYQTVQEFQAAIRQYEAHSASIVMAERANEGLEVARKSDNYDSYATAVFEYQESLKLWDENEKARVGVSKAKLAYATAALRKSDLDLAESLLDVNDTSHGSCLTLIAEAKRDREVKKLRLKAQRRAIIGLGASVFVAVSCGLVGVSYFFLQAAEQRDLAVANETEANTQKRIAQQNEAEATTQKKNAETERDNAKKARDDEEKQRVIAQEQEKLAKQNEQLAKDNEAKALVAEKDARDEKERAEYEAYVALIGLSAAKIDENAFGYARELLNQCKPELRNWEWGRLMYLCEQSVRDIPVKDRVDAVAFSHDGKRFATGGWNGLAQVFNTEDAALIATIQHRGLYVYAVAFSPIANEIATGGSDREGYLRIWNADTGEPVRTLAGHSDGVLSVSYSRDGKKLLTSSFDNTARLWDVDSGKLLHTFSGHTWWVWSAALSPDEKRIVTASQDGTALVWSVENGQHGPPFMGHSGPVYAASFSPDGQQVVTGGYDKRVMLWKPSDVTPFDYKALVEGQTPPPPKFRGLDGHQAAVRCVAFAHDGKLILSGGHDNTVKVWSADSGELVKTLRGHANWVKSCAFSPDGKWALSGGYDNFARLWNVEGYEEARVLQGKWLRGHTDAVMAVGFSPNGDELVTASRDRTAQTWNAATGKPTVLFEEGHAFLASSAVFYPNGKRLVTSAVDSTTRVWDVAAGVEKLRLENTGRAAAVAVSHDNRWLLTGGDSKAEGVWVAQLWDAETGKLVRALSGHGSEVTAAAFSSDDRFCFTGDSIGRGVLWRTDSGEEVRRLSWHTSKISAARFLDGGQRLLTASDDKTVAQWDVSNLADDPKSVTLIEKMTLKHDESVLSLEVVSSRKLAITCTTSGAVRLWDIERAAELRTLPVGKTNVNAVSLSRDGRFAVTVHPDERLVRLWDVENAREILVPPAEGRPAAAFLDLNKLGGLVWSATFSPSADNVVTIGGNESRLWEIHADTAQPHELMSFSPHAAVASVSYSPDGLRLVTGSWDNSARIWDAKTGKAELKLVGEHTGYVNCAVFSHNGRFVLTASDDKSAKLWDGTTGKVIRTFKGHTDPVRFGIFSHDDTQVLTASDDKTCRIWNTETAELVRELKGHGFGVLCAAFSSDGKRVITGSDDNTARIWDVEKGETLLILSGHTASVASVAFSPDGKRVLSASEDFTAKLWDSQTGKEILNLKGHSQELTSIAFSGDGRYILTGSRDGTAILWLTTDWQAPAKVAKKPSR